jgi:hypothetical protein
MWTHCSMAWLKAKLPDADYCDWRELHAFERSADQWHGASDDIHQLNAVAFDADGCRSGDGRKPVSERGIPAPGGGASSAASVAINNSALGAITLSPATMPVGKTTSTVIARGSGNTLLTLTGSIFIPGVAVNWNGSYRTTTIVDATHVLVAIPAADLAVAGTASVTAVNPGAGSSSAITITIQ